MVAAKTRWAFEADIRGDFNHIQHDWLLKMVAHRIGDGALLRLLLRVDTQGHPVPYRLHVRQFLLGVPLTAHPQIVDVPHQVRPLLSPAPDSVGIQHVFGNIPRRRSSWQ